MKCSRVNRRFTRCRMATVAPMSPVHHPERFFTIYSDHFASANVLAAGWAVNSQLIVDAVKYQQPMVVGLRRLSLPSGQLRLHGCDMLQSPGRIGVFMRLCLKFLQRALNVSFLLQYQTQREVIFAKVIWPLDADSPPDDIFGQVQLLPL